MLDVRQRLTAPDLPGRLARLRFRGADVDDALTAVRRTLDRPRELAAVQATAERLLPLVGRLDDPLADPDPLAEDPDDAARFGVGVRPLLALLATVPEVRAFHAGRGVGAEDSWWALADLGQQAWVHRRTFGGFGLHTYSWLRMSWSGSLYWLGRLQFNLQRDGGEWVLSTHIPATGPLDPAAVDDALARADAFFAAHFADHPARDFWCSSWLLDPDLATVLPAGSNLVRFQRRWALYGEPTRGDDDVRFFSFFRRGEVALDDLPQQTTLQRGLVGRWRAGGHWHSRQGRIPRVAGVVCPEVAS